MDLHDYLFEYSPCVYYYCFILLFMNLLLFFLLFIHVRFIASFVFTFSFFSCRVISLAMGLCAANSSGHLSNHADVAPNHAGITFAISNTIVSKLHFFFLMMFYSIFSSLTH